MTATTRDPDDHPRTDVIRIDGYSDLVAIGHGGLGDVYRARRESTGGTVAIKVLRDVSDESVAWHRTRRELTALIALAGHANVVQLLEVLDLDDGPALVMEFAPNGSVADLLHERGGTLSPGEAVLVGRQTAAALAAAHELGIVHRDVKPQNLLVDAYGQVKLCDFGVAALTRSEEFRTRTNALSMRYASPEDLDEDAVVGPESDVYSLGATLLHLVHGAPPSLKERLAPWVPPGAAAAVDAGDGVDAAGDPVAAIDALLVDCLHPDPSVRPSAAALHERLEQVEWNLTDRRRALDVEGVEFADLGEITGQRAAPVPPAAAAPPGVPSSSASSAPAAPPPTRRSDEATTARRPDAPPPRPAPPPEPPPRRRGRWLVAVALVALAAVAAVVFWPGGDDDPEPAVATVPPTEVVATVTAPPTQPSTEPPAEPVEFAIVERPSGLTPITDPSIVWPFGEVGECLVQLPDAVELTPVSCDEPHDLQRTAVDDLRVDVADFDDSGLEQAARVRCEVALETFVGVSYEDSELEAPYTRPSVDTFESEPRYQCFVGRGGSRLIGDARHTNR